MEPLKIFVAWRVNAIRLNIRSGSCWRYYEATPELLSFAVRKALPELVFLLVKGVHGGRAETVGW